MGKQSIFLSYRREDSAGHTGRLHDRFVAHYGAERVFWDIDNIPPGEDFVDAIDQTLDNCAIVLVVVGPRWSAVVDGSGRRRLDDESDFHRLEVHRALERKIPLLPILVGGARMPPQSELPGDIRAFARRNAFEVTDQRFSYDVSKLIEAIDGRLASSKLEAEAAGATKSESTAEPPGSGSGATSAQPEVKTAGDGGRPASRFPVAAALGVGALVALFGGVAALSPRKAPDVAPAVPAPAAWAWVGDTERKIYFRAGCAAAGEIPMSRSRVFESESEATGLGYTRLTKPGC